jgi:hypothetical protein
VSTGANGIVSASVFLVDEHVPGVPGERSTSKHPGARGARLQRGVLLALVVRVAERVGRCAGEHAGKRDHHAVHADIVVGRAQGLVLRPVRRFGERPRALAGALVRGVARPRVRPPGARVRAVLPAPHAAEAFDHHVRVREHQHEATLPGPRPRRELAHLGQRQGLAEGVLVVGDLVVKEDARVAAAARRGVGQVGLVKCAPPLRYRRRRGRRLGSQRLDEVHDDGFLLRRDRAVPDDGHGDVAVVDEVLGGRDVVKLEIPAIA